MKKRLFSTVVMVLIIINSVFPVGAVSGKGTENNPFRIGTAEELLLLADFPDCYFELESDIELTGTWTPIEDFSGHFDGKGHTITVKAYKNVANCGFFGTLSGIVENLIICGNDINLSPYDDKSNIGVIAGVCSGAIQGCKVTGKITFSASFRNTINAGGICGNLIGMIKQCMNEATVSLVHKNNYPYDGDVRYGGIVYKNEEGSVVSDCINLDDAISSSSSAYYSGIAAYNYGNIINCCSAGGKELYTSTSKRGISGGTLSNCYFDKNLLNYDGYSTDYGIPKSTLAMKMEATFEGWDFDTVWAIDESEENPINDGYPYLRCFYDDFTCPITVSTISAVENKLVLDTKISDTSDTYVLHIALYDSADRLCDYVIIPNSRQLKDVFAVFDDDKNAEYAKIFTWSAQNVVEPVAVNETVTIVR